jgi:DNA-binding NarL/FixJ family response regulator
MIFDFGAIIFLTGHLHPEIVQAAFGAGGCGYVHKEDAFGELLPSLESALVGKRYLSQSVTDHGDVT